MLKKIITSDEMGVDSSIECRACGIGFNFDDLLFHTVVVNGMF